jgi:hypothetical protein
VRLGQHVLSMGIWLVGWQHLRFRAREEAEGVLWYLGAYASALSGWQQAVCALEQSRTGGKEGAVGAEGGRKRGGSKGGKGDTQGRPWR